jgi:hypothetical protein
MPRGPIAKVGPRRPYGNACGRGADTDRPVAAARPALRPMAALGCLPPTAMMILGTVVSAGVGGRHEGIAGLMASLVVGTVGGIAPFWGWSAPRTVFARDRDDPRRSVVIAPQLGSDLPSAWRWLARSRPQPSPGPGRSDAEGVRAASGIGLGTGSDRAFRPS